MLLGCYAMGDYALFFAHVVYLVRNRDVHGMPELCHEVDALCLCHWIKISFGSHDSPLIP